MKRVVVIGCCGSGKSTLARLLGRRSDLPVYYLDQIFWQPGWVEGNKEEVDKKHQEIIERDKWIIDGTSKRTLPARLERADTVIFLDFPLWLCMYRIIKRTITGYGRVRFDMAEDCPERFDWVFLRYTMAYKKEINPIIVKALEKCGDDTVIHHFTDHKELEKRLCDVR